MDLNIVGFVKSLVPSFSKSDVEADLEQSIDSIPSIVEVFTSMESVIKGVKLSSKEAKNIEKILLKEFNDHKGKYKLSSTKNIGSDITGMFVNVKANASYILENIADAKGDVIVSQALTAVRANLFRAVGHIYFLTRFGLDLSNYLYTKEAQNITDDLDPSYKLVKKQEQFVEKNAWLFARVLCVYGQPHDIFKSSLEKIQEIIMVKDKLDEVVEAYDADDLELTTLLPNGFLGSPILSIRMIFAEWSAQRYHNLKTKKRLIELRYLHLKVLKEQGQLDPGLEKEIGYLENRNKEISMYLDKVESEVGDL